MSFDSPRRETDSVWRTPRNWRFVAALQRLMRAKRLRSSMIDRIVFDDEAETLAIWFKRSGKYLYHGVPPAIYDAMGRAESAGHFFNDCVKGHFRCEPLDKRYRPE